MGTYHRADLGLLILRVAIGSIFVLHGWMNSVAGQESFVREMLQMAGWSMPGVFFWFVTVFELAAGFLLLLGTWVQWAALLLGVEMVVAVALFHLRQGFFIVAIPNVPLAYGFEYHVALVGGLACIALAGPGKWALDHRLTGPSGAPRGT
ncbi:MAG: DoxX family protein [Gemmatimonadales bacterium]